MNLPALYPESNAMFSPDEKHIVVGRSAASREDKGALVFLSREGLEVESTVECDPGVGVVRVFWHSKINQVSARPLSSHTGTLANRSAPDCHGPQ